jgi:hypothetical protein
MIEYNPVGEDGTKWSVVIRTDIQRHLPSLAMPEYWNFSADENLRWVSDVLAWEDGSERGHEVADLRVVGYEPPSDDELEKVRERRREWLSNFRR